MRVEPYSDRWFVDMMEIAKLFHKEAGAAHIGTLDVDNLFTFVEQEKKAGYHQNAFLMIEDSRCVGFLYGREHRYPGTAKRMFQEVFFYVREEARKSAVAFIREIERVLKVRGIEMFIMTALSNYRHDGLMRFYQGLGYKPMETHLMKSL